MDAASKIKSFLMAIVIPFGASTIGLADDPEPSTTCPKGKCQASVGQDTCTACCPDSDCCHTNACAETAGTFTAIQPGIASLVGGWLTRSPKFSAEFAIHFGSKDPVNKLGANVPVVDVATKATETKATSALDQVPTIGKPMKFAERIPRIQLGEIVGDVIVCGHRICAANKCYDVKDEPVTGTHCDNNQDTDAGNTIEQEEPIMVVPMAPPAPPGLEVARADYDSNESEASVILRNSGLSNVHLSIPATTVVDLLVAKTELSIRLEMTEQLMHERQLATVQVQALAERNARLATQLAVAEARQQASDSLTASLVDRTEMAIKLASMESKSAPAQESNASRTVQAIQEDLSNIRRQIALLRRSGPVPFAQSYVGLPPPRPYIPTAQLPTNPYNDEASSASPTENDCGSETTVK
jgi:hypothetical protein